MATCNLAGIVVSNVESEEQYAEVAYYALLMIDKCIHLAHYELPVGRDLAQAPERWRRHSGPGAP